MTVIALDAMGGDDAPRTTVAGAVEAARGGIEVALVGDSDALEAELGRLRGESREAETTPLRIVHAPDRIEMGDKAAREIRRRRESSIYVATDLVKRGEADAVLSMGNTGATMAAALVVLGRLPGIERPALAASAPTPSGGIVLVLDVGANADGRPAHLVQFAHLGSAYLRSVYGIERPRVGLLSIGEEPTKGSSFVLEAHALLAGDEQIDFAGNVEGADVINGAAQVVVTDGFTGNVALKFVEATASMLFTELRAAARGSLRARLGGALLLPSLRGVRDRLDDRARGCVPLLGVDGAVFVGHGRSDARTVANAIRTAASAVDQGMLRALASSADASAGSTEGAP